MKKINYHLMAIMLVLAAVIGFNYQYGKETFVFCGVAQNKEMEIRLEHPVTINKIYVTPNKKVTKGALLMEVSRSGLQLEESGLVHEVARLEAQHQIWKTNIEATIRQLQAEKTSKTSEIQNQIQQLETEIAINKSLVKDLKSISPTTDKNGLSPNQLKITGLKQELQLNLHRINAEIRKLEKELNAPENPLKIQIAKLQEELGFVNQETEQLSIYAPEEGVVGSLFCKVGEQLPAFANLLNFYEEKPTFVKGYVLETLLLKVKENDSLIVNSSVHTSINCKGKIIGLGSRIIEIPERLRKNPAFKTYGREVIVAIPATNSFLQNEKVFLKLELEEAPRIKGLMHALNTPKNAAALTEK